jgi:hypothetical protein
MVVGVAVWLRLWRGRCHVLSVCHRRLIRIALRWDGEGDGVLAAKNICG